MVVIGGGFDYRGPKEISYLFIDGGCFRQLIQDTSERYEGFDIQQIDFSKLARNYSKKFYYDSVPSKRKNESAEEYSQRVSEKEAFFDSLRAIDGYHVYEGDTRRRRKVVQQKKVDIMIAVDMLTHSFRRNMHKAALLTADLDFKPLVDALVQDGMHVTLMYPHEKPNKELIYSADARWPLTYRDLHQWTLDDYRNAHPLPSATSEPGKIKIQGTLKDEWSTAMGTVAKMYKNESEGTYTVVFPSAVNRDRNDHVYVTHNDPVLLKRYVTECFREFWKSPI